MGQSNDAREHNNSVAGNQDRHNYGGIILVYRWGMPAMFSRETVTKQASGGAAAFNLYDNITKK